MLLPGDPLQHSWSCSSPSLALGARHRGSHAPLQPVSPSAAARIRLPPQNCAPRRVGAAPAPLPPGRAPAQAVYQRAQQCMGSAAGTAATGADTGIGARAGICRRQQTCCVPVLTAAASLLTGKAGEPAWVRNLIRYAQGQAEPLPTASAAAEGLQAGWGHSLGWRFHPVGAGGPKIALWGGRRGEVPLCSMLLAQGSGCVSRRHLTARPAALGRRQPAGSLCPAPEPPLLTQPVPAGSASGQTWKGTSARGQAHIHPPPGLGSSTPKVPCIRQALQPAAGRVAQGCCQHPRLSQSMLPAAEAAAGTHGRVLSS